MVIAFGCLMLSSQQLLSECGFFIAFSILFDTFVVRTIIVPCVMVVLGPRNWWPRKMPPITVTVNVDNGLFDGEQQPLLTSPSLSRV